MQKRGYVLVVSVAVAVVLSVYCGSLLVRSVSELGHSTRSLSLSASIHLAEAAVDHAIANLRSNTDTDIASTPLNQGTYWAEVDPLGSSRHQVTAHGSTAGEQRDIEVVAELSPRSIFEFALFGDTQVEVSGSANTDSYDSASAAYDPDTAGDSGDIGTNSITAGGITFGGGGMFVDGQVKVGADVDDPESIVTNFDPELVTAEPPVVSTPSTFSMPAVDPADAGFDPATNCVNRTISGNTTLQLAAGTYCYNNLTIQGGGELTTDGSGQVTIYLTGALVSQGNSTVGVDDDPTQLLVLMSSRAEATLEEGTITGSTKFFGALYGPSATINISGNAEIFGSIIADQIAITGSAAIHYDEALQDLDNVSNASDVKIVSWRELD